MRHMQEGRHRGQLVIHGLGWSYCNVLRRTVALCLCWAVSSPSITLHRDYPRPRHMITQYSLQTESWRLPSCIFDGIITLAWYREQRKRMKDPWILDPVVHLYGMLDTFAFRTLVSNRPVRDCRLCSGSTRFKANTSFVLKPVKLERVFFLTREISVIWRLIMMSINTITFFRIMH